MTQTEMTFTEHLVELRDRLTRSAIAVLIGFFVAYNWHVELFDLLAGPVLQGLAANGVYKLQALQITETIIVYMKVSIVASLICMAPYVLWQIWAFVAPGLLPHERRWIFPIVVFSSLFFFLGVAFAYTVMMPFMTSFLAGMTQEGGRVEMLMTISNAFSFSLMTLLLFGVIFELPLVIFFLSILGLVNHTRLIKFFRYFIVISFIVGAILTPPDPISQTLMAVPLIALYGIGILISFLVARRRSEGGEGAPLVTGRLWATVVIALVFVGVGIWAIITMLRPALRPVDLVPREVALVSGVAPAHLEGLADGAVDATLDSVAAGDEAAEVREALRAAVVGAGDASLLVVGAQGQAALLIPGALDGESVPAAVAGDRAAALPGGTLAYGDPALIGLIVACSEDADLCLAGDPVHAKRLESLGQSGPLWSYAPEAGDPWRALLPGGAEVEASTALAVVLSPSKGEAELRMVLTLPDASAARSWRARTLAWRDQRERDQAQEQRTAAQDAAMTGLTAAVRELAAATRQLAATSGGSARAALLVKLDAVTKRLGTEAPAADAPGDAHGQSLLDRLPPKALRSWDVSTDGSDAVLTARFAAGAVPTVLRALDEAAHP